MDLSQHDLAMLEEIKAREGHGTRAEAMRELIRDRGRIYNRSQREKDMLALGDVILTKLDKLHDLSARTGEDVREVLARIDEDALVDEET